MAKDMKSYGWLNRLVDKITKADAPLNNSFDYYGFHVNQSSGTPNYTAVVIFENYMSSERSEMVYFSFDFSTKNLHFVDYKNLEIRQSVIDAFLLCYNEVRISDDILKSRMNKLELCINSSFGYDDGAVEQANKELESIDNIPLGWISAVN